MRGATLFSGFGLVEAMLTDVVDFQHAVEYDADIAQVYADNYGPRVTVARVQDVAYETWGALDYLHASPSCTRASNANPGRGETEEDVSTAAAVVRALEATQPRAFTLENVRQYATAKGIDGGRGFLSYRMILGALERLGYMYASETVCAADFGVPQERYRLMVRAVRGALLPPLPPPTPWAGWLGAVEDLLPGLPDDAFAPWQLQRMPERYHQMMAQGGVPFLVSAAGSDANRMLASDPASTVMASHKTMPGRAFIMEGTAGGAKSVVMPTIRSDGEHGFTVRTGNAPRAFVVGGANAGRPLSIRTDGEPMLTVVTDHERDVRRAFVVAGLANDRGKGVTVRDGNEPYMTLNGSDDKRPARASNARAGRVVRMDARCNARFQSLPDSYRLPANKKLAMKGIGNGVPSLMMWKIVTQLLEVVR